MGVGERGRQKSPIEEGKGKGGPNFPQKKSSVDFCRLLTRKGARGASRGRRRKKKKKEGF